MLVMKCQNSIKSGKINLMKYKRANVLINDIILKFQHSIISKELVKLRKK